MNEEKLNTFKIELLQAIIACNDVEKLKQVKLLLARESMNMVREEKIAYEKDVLSEKQTQELEKRIKLLREGKAEKFSYEEVKKRIEKKYSG